MFSYTKDDLQIDGNEDAKRVREDSTTASHQKSYIHLVAKRSADEKSFYHPFCVLANHTGENGAESSPKILFCRNDPSPIRGEQDDTRSPGVVCVSSDHSAVKDGAWKKCKKCPPLEYKWEDVFHAFEFKLGPPTNEHTGKEILQTPKPSQEEVQEIEAESTVSTQVSSMVSSSSPAKSSENSNQPANPKKRFITESEEPDNKRQKSGVTTQRDWVRQCYRYAIDAKSKADKRMHFMGALAAGTHVWICYYDRSGVVYSSSILINTDAGFYQFILLLMGLNNLEYTSRGLCERMRKLPLDSSTGVGSWIMKISNMTFTLLGTFGRRRPYRLPERGTRVFRGRLSNDASEKVYVIKTSWSIKNGSSEVIIIDTARERLKDLLEDTKSGADDSVGDDLPECLPSYHWSEDIKGMITGVRGSMKDCEVRIHRAKVFVMHFPIYELTDTRGFMQAYRDNFQVHHFLWSKSVHHHDISVGNLVYRKDANGGLHCGVLNDWDLSKLDANANESLFRTGTGAFLSMEFLLIKDVVHLERHDWESAFYVLVWITTRYKDGKEVDTEDLVQWMSLDHGISQSAKNLYLTFWAIRPTVRTFGALFEHWIDPISMLFVEGYAAYNGALKKKDKRTPFDNDTMGGKVTYEKLWDILKEDLPEMSS